VREEENLFGLPASERMQKTIDEYRVFLTAATNGWIADYYPEKNYSVGGYLMFMKFLSDGRVTVNCETATNLPAQVSDTSNFDIFAEQGPILSFSSYNRVMHYFSEPLGSSDVDGRSGDYEFVIMKIVLPDEIHLKGKKHGNKLVLRRNTLDPETYYGEVDKIKEDIVRFGAFRLLVNDRVIDSLSISERTMTGDSISVAWTYTPEGMRLYEPLVINGVTMLNFKWDSEKGRYNCQDSGVNACFEGYFSPDFQLQYEDFLGEWTMQYHGGSRIVWSEATVTISTRTKYRSFTLHSDEIFSFPMGLELTYDLKKGTIALLNQNIEYNYFSATHLRVCSYDLNAGYISTADFGVIGMDGKWNNDENGKRQIHFVDNKRWGTYKPNGIMFRLYNGSASLGSYADNKGGYVFSDITLTKK
jgi:hypothetical protein